MQNVWDDGMKFQRALISQDLAEGVSLQALGLRYFSPREVDYGGWVMLDIEIVVLLIFKSTFFFFMVLWGLEQEMAEMLFYVHFFWMLACLSLQIANLHSFPPAFTFPSQVSWRQR
jgi:hypothetical protein